MYGNSFWRVFRPGVSPSRCDVAGAVAFREDDAAYITAQTLYIEGGRLALNFTVPVRENA